MKRILAVITTMILMAGCAQLDSLTTKSADKVADLIIGYCTTTDEAVRLSFRAKINNELKARGVPFEASINCDYD